MVPLVLIAALCVPAASLRAADDFVTFESGHVRPLALSPDGGRLFAVNTPDARLEIFDVDAAGIRHVASVPVGLEPVAVAARGDGEVWVVNHVSDSVSVVDVAADPPRVVRTLLVGDEPRDVVFGGPGRSRAFVSAAHRGPHRPGAADAGTPGVGRADVWVFDATDPGAASGGTPLAIVTLFGDTPGALAVSPNGASVYAAVFHSGNRTTVVPERLVCDGGPAAPPCAVDGIPAPGGLPGPRTNADGVPGPETGLIVRVDPATGHWQDELGRAWDAAVGFTLPDLDVFRLDAATLAVTGEFAHVGTVLYGMAVNPASGAVYVANTEARNEARFEGPGRFAGRSLRGRLHESRVTVLRDGAVLPRHLNPHIDYGVVPSPPGTRERSLALPAGLAVSEDGGTLWIAALGSGVVAAADTAALEAGAFVPDAADHVPVTGGGPSGLVLDARRGRLHVFTRFDNGVSTIDVASRREVAHVRLHDPEPPAVVAGRPLLYDARATSSNGEAACATCHVFGDLDGLAWDLGNPDDRVVDNPNPIHFGEAQPFHPLKGPMSTQSLRGMAHAGPMHWRGDRTGGLADDGDGDPLAADQAFAQFVVAFENLLGRDAPIDAEAMRRFGAFALELTYPPNPHRALDGTLSPEQQAGRDLYFGRVTDTAFNCAGCHNLEPRNGVFGADGQSALQIGPQLMKIPHLRNLYQKVGMFRGGGAAAGPQVRGFGFTHDGSVDTVLHFLGGRPFTLAESERRQLEAFVLAYDSDLAPVVGQQVTGVGPDASARADLLRARAEAGDCDLIATAVLDGAPRGWVQGTGGQMVGDRADDQPIDHATLRTRVAEQGGVLTYTCVPPGSGVRAGIDRDRDGFLDGDERIAGTDPADAASTPPGSPFPLRRATVRTTTLRLSGRRDGTQPARVVFATRTRRDDASHRIVPPPRDTAFDPTRHGATLRIYNAGFTSDVAVLALPARGWRALGSLARPKGYRFRGRANGRTLRVLVARDRIDVAGAAPYSLDEPAQGSVAVRLSTGLLDGGWCAVARARPRGRLGSTAASDRPGRFVGASAPPPATCPSIP